MDLPRAERRGAKFFLELFARSRKHDSLLSMSMISSVLPYIQIAVSVLLTLAILLQHSGAQNGGALGGGGDMSSVFHTRRGPEKVLFVATIVLGVLFALTSFLSLIS
jgi:protein translocase SecG subunit